HQAALSLPSPVCLPQHRQQHVVDLRVIDPWQFLQQLLGLLFFEPAALSPGRGIMALVFSLLLLDAFCRTSLLPLPVLDFLQQFLASAVLRQSLGPLPIGRRLRPKLQRASTLQLFIPTLQVIQQNPPGHAVDRQVMHDQQQPSPRSSQIVFHRPHHAPCAHTNSPLFLAPTPLHRLDLPFDPRRRKFHSTISSLRHSHRVALYPVSIFTLVPQPQDVVLPDQPPHDLLQQPTIDLRLQLDQHRLVVMLRLGQAPREEGSLDRRQRYFPAQISLFAFHRMPRTCDLRQPPDRLALEELSRRQLQPSLTGFRDHLDAQDRVTSQLEEVVVDSDPLHSQRLRPDLTQDFFLRSPCRDMTGPNCTQFRPWQGSPIDLSIGRQRHPFHLDKHRRRHILWQFLL